MSNYGYNDYLNEIADDGGTGLKADEYEQSDNPWGYKYDDISEDASNDEPMAEYNPYGEFGENEYIPFQNDGEDEEYGQEQEYGGEGEYGEGGNNKEKRKTLSERYDGMKQGIGNMAGNVRNFAQGVRNAPGNIANGIKNAPGNIANGIKNAPGKIKKITVEMVLKFWDIIIKKAKAVIDKIKMIICFNPINWLLSKAMEWLASINPIEFVKIIIKMAIDGIIGAIFPFRDMLEYIFNSIVEIRDLLLKIVNDVKSIGGKGGKAKATT